MNRAVRELLERLAATKPLVLILDDFHWADPASVDLIGSLLRRPPSAPVLLVMGARPHQGPTRLASVLDRALRERTLTRIELDPLTQRRSRRDARASRPRPDDGGALRGIRGKPVLSRTARPIARAAGPTAAVRQVSARRRPSPAARPGGADARSSRCSPASAADARGRVGGGRSVRAGAGGRGSRRQRAARRWRPSMSCSRATSSGDRRAAAVPLPASHRASRGVRVTPGRLAHRSPRASGAGAAGARSGRGNPSPSRRDLGQGRRHGRRGHTGGGRPDLRARERRRSRRAGSRGRCGCCPTTRRSENGSICCWPTRRRWRPPAGSLTPMKRSSRASPSSPPRTPRSGCKLSADLLAHRAPARSPRRGACAPDRPRWSRCPTRQEPTPSGS